MKRVPELSPSWLPRHQRRYIDRRLHRLMHLDVCSVCGGKLEHNTRTFSGLDLQNNVALAGECCAGQIVELFGVGLFSHRNYDFLLPHDSEPTAGVEPTNEQIIEAIATHQEIIADTDKQMERIERHGGIGRRVPSVSTLSHPWKDDDRRWFEQHQKRAHRARMPFPGEADKAAAETPAGHVLIILLRQVEPGTRIKVGRYLNADLPPVPDDEALIHALFEVAIQREPAPANSEALHALIEKYRVAEGPGQ